MLSHADILRALDAKRDAGEIRNRDIGDALKLPSSRVAEMFKGRRALKVDEAAILTERFNLEGGASPPKSSSVARVRQARGLTVADVARLLGGGAKAETVRAIETGELELTPEWAKRIAEALDVSPAALLASGDFHPVRRVPLVGFIAGGNWREAVEDPLALVPCEDGGPNTFALVVSGDSMDQIAPDGSRIYIDPDDIGLKDRGLYAIMNSDGETTFKRYDSGAGLFVPVSSNKLHQPIQVGREPFTIVGRVVGQWVRH